MRCGAGGRRADWLDPKKARLPCPGWVQPAGCNRLGLRSTRLAPRTPKKGVPRASPAALQPRGVAGGWGRVEPAARPAGSTRTQAAVGFCQATATPEGCGWPGRSELRSLAGVQHPQDTEVRAATASGCSPSDARRPRSDRQSAAANQLRRRQSAPPSLPRRPQAPKRSPFRRRQPAQAPPIRTALGAERAPATKRSTFRRRQRPSRRNDGQAQTPPVAAAANHLRRRQPPLSRRSGLRRRCRRRVRRAAARRRARGSQTSR